MLILIIVIVIILLISFIIIDQIKEYYSSLDPKLLTLKHKLNEFFSQSKEWEYPLHKLNDYNIMEHIELYRGNKSFTINKKKVYICMKNSNDEYYNNNMLIYVIAHELSHVICPEIGHTELFHEIFNALLNELYKYGLYNYAIPIEENYCENGDNNI